MDNLSNEHELNSKAKLVTRPGKSLRGALRWMLVPLVAFGLGALADKQGLKKKLDSTTLHMYVLKALSGVRGASLAVVASDNAGANLSLSQASAALDALPSLLEADHKEVLIAMQKSAAQALAEVKTNLNSAQPDLDQLTKNLVQLEDNLFPNP